MTRRVDKFLEVEASVARESEVLLKDLGSYALDAFEKIAEVYETTARLISESRLDSEIVNSAVSAFKRINEHQVPRLNRLLKDPTVRANQTIRDAADAWLATWARYGQKVAFNHVYRQFRWGATDIRRLRLTSSSGRMRLGVEGFAYASIFSKRPRQAVRWLDPDSDHEALFRSLLPDVKTELHKYGLALAYSYGSGFGSHASFAGAAASTTFQPTESTLRVSMGDEDFDPADPFTFHTAVAFFLRIQQRLLDALPDVFADLRTRECETDRQAVRRAVDDVWWALTRRFADRVTELQKLGPAGVAARRQSRPEPTIVRK